MSVNSSSTPAQIRDLCRQEKFSSPTPGLASGYVQANLIILPKSAAFDFLLFCHRNPKPCPLLDVTEVGDPQPRKVAPGSDLRTDLPRYHVFRHGQLVEEVTSIKQFWRDDLVAFLLGCSFTFESAILSAGLPIRHIEEKKNVPMYITNQACVSAGMFSGPLVVSMRPLSTTDAIKAVQVTSRYPQGHGAPVHLGDPSAIGIRDLNRPNFGDAVTIRSGEIAAFWACGVTSQTAILQAKPEIAISHAPGHMFITDVKDESFS
jgi:uncharacterized protein YcsI (UPF0317 family)